MRIVKFSFVFVVFINLYLNIVLVFNYHQLSSTMFICQTNVLFRPISLGDLLFVPSLDMSEILLTGRYPINQLIIIQTINKLFL